MADTTSAASVATTTRPAFGSHGPAPHLDDHRRAGDVDHGLAGQARGLHARGDDDERISHFTSLICVKPRQLVPVRVHIERRPARLQADAEFL